MEQSATRSKGHRSRKLPKTITPEEFDRLLAQTSSRSPSGKRNAALLSVLWDCGLRGAEACDLAPEDVRMRRGGPVITVVDGKGGADRANRPVPSRTWALVERWLAVRPESDYLFATLDGGRLRENYVRAALARYSERAGVFKRTPDGQRAINPHMLRHSYASRLIESAPVNVVQAALGHANLGTTQRCLHVNDATMQEQILRALESNIEGDDTEATQDVVTVDRSELRALVAEVVRDELRRLAT